MLTIDYGSVILGRRRRASAWHGVADSLALDDLAEKWGVDGPGLLAKGARYTYAQNAAIVDAVERWWLSEPSPSAHGRDRDASAG